MTPPTLPREGVKEGGKDMANADDLRRLAQEVASAYEERVKNISDINNS